MLSGRELGGRRARLVLAALAMADGPISGDSLAEIVWDGEPPATWSSALRGVVLVLRSSLERIGLGDQALILTAPNGYALSPEVAVDLRTVSEQVDEAERVLADERPAAALALLSELGEVAGTRVLPGDAGAWLDQQRGRVDALAERGALVVVAAASAVGDHAAAIRVARRLVTSNPLDELFHQALIRALDRAGDRAGAIGAFENCREILAERLGVDPSRLTVEAYLEALRSDVRSTVAELPVRTTRFFGRAFELGELSGAIVFPGLVTVTGVGGVGKSRLVVEALGTGVVALDGGTFWIDLSALVDDELVAFTVARALDVPSAAADPGEATARLLAPLGRAALILDGCDRVVDGAASLVATLAAGCPGLTIVATSRRPMGLPGETIVRVAPFDRAESETPHDRSTGGAAVQAGPALELILDRAAAGGRPVQVSATTRPLLEALVRRSGGVPLALEILAAQLTVQSIGDLMDSLAQLDDTDEGLRGILRQSVETLSPAESDVFRRLSVIGGAARLPLIRSVVAGAELPPARVVRVLAELADRGLLRVDTAGARWLYELDDDIQRFAGELLTENGELAATQQRLFEAVVGVLPDDPKLPPGPYLDDVTDILASVRGLLGAAVDGGIPREQGLELAFRLHRYWAATGVAEGRFWLGRLLTEAPPSDWSSFATFALGYLSYWAGDVEAALSELTAAAELLGTIDDSYTARALIFAAGIADDLDRGDEAVAQLRQAVEIAERRGEINLRSAAVSGIGSVLAERGDPEAAQHAAIAVGLSRTSGSDDQLGVVLANASMVCWQVGMFDEARAYAVEARTLLADSKRIARVIALTTSAGLALADGDASASVDFARLADSDATELGVEREAPLIRCVLARALFATGALPDAAASAADAIRAARALDYEFPLALCFETAAVVVGATDGRLAARLLATAETLRLRGDRPAPPSLRMDSAFSGDEHQGAAGRGEPPMSVSDATDAALAALGALAAARVSAGGRQTPSAAGLS